VHQPFAFHPAGGARGTRRHSLHATRWRRRRHGDESVARLRRERRMRDRPRAGRHPETKKPCG
jgi:hypothetical protein